MDIDKTIFLEMYMLLGLILCSNHQTLYELTDNKWHSALSVVWGIMALIAGCYMVWEIIKDGRNKRG